MKSIFDPVAIGGIQSKNRIVRSATAESYASGQKRFNEGNLPLYEKLAKGEVGVIITGMLGVDENSSFNPRMPNAGDEGFVDGLRLIADHVHRYDSKVVVQLVHAGAKAVPPGAAHPPLGPSALPIVPDRPARAMTKEEIAAVAAAFGRAAAKCKEAGVDGVQIHGAHGYLLSQFLSPHCNQRSDEYGGDIANRGRIVLETFEAMRREAGRDYPIWIKINCHDLVDESITLEECLWLCRELEKSGLLAVEVSAGLGFGRSTSPSKPIAAESDEGSFGKEALEIARSLSISVISTGGYQTPEVMERWLNEGAIEAIGLCRPLIREPGLVKRWKDGDKKKASCLTCNRCYRLQEGLKCQPRTEQ